MGSGRCDEIAGVGERVDHRLTETHQEDMLGVTDSAGQRPYRVRLRPLRSTGPTNGSPSQVRLRGLRARRCTARGEHGDGCHGSPCHVCHAARSRVAAHDVNLRSRSLQAML